MKKFRFFWEDDDIPDLVEATNFEEISKFDEQPEESKAAEVTSNDNLEEISWTGLITIDNFLSSGKTCFARRKKMVVFCHNILLRIQYKVKWKGW